MLLVILSVVALSCFYCARHPAIDLELGPVQGPQDIVERVNANAGRMGTLRAEVRLDADHIPQSRLTKARVLFSEPDRYRIKFSALFGRTVALMIIDGQEASLYLPDRNRLYQGQFTPRGLGRVLGLEIGLDELMKALAGTVRLSSLERLIDYRATEDGYELRFGRGPGHQVVTVASDGLRILEIRDYGTGEQPGLIRTYRDHLLLDGVLRPGRVNLIFPSRGEEIEVTFLNQQVNPLVAEEDFQLPLPDSVERIWLDFE
jgi:hypothetical protein